MIVIVCVSKERGRRVIVKAEYSVRGANSRCVFTNLEVRSEGFYDDIVVLGVKWQIARALTSN